MLVADYERRAGAGAAYREAVGITNPCQAASPEPHHGNPELEQMRQEVIRELEIANEAAMWAHMDRGQLEAHQTAAERAQATAPPDVSDQLRATAHAETDAWQQAAAQASGDEAEAHGAENLAGLLGSQRQQLETQNTEHEQWADLTRTVRENGDKATAELNRRDLQATTGQAPAEARHLGLRPETEPGTDRRRHWNGGASSKRTWPPPAAPSTGSTRPPSTQACHGRPDTSRERRPSPKLRLRRSHCALNQPQDTTIPPHLSPTRLAT